MRSKSAPKRRINPDPIYGNIMVSKLINAIMLDGKKTAAEKQVYNALKIIASKTNQDGLSVFLTSLENIKPQMEVRARRIGGAAYQIPTPVRGERKDSLALRWLIIAARARSNSEYHTFADKLASEVIDAFNNQGAAIKKRTDVHKMAEANRAFAHFKW
jgi:small subunit ribosomal protein S7